MAGTKAEAFANKSLMEISLVAVQWEINKISEIGKIKNQIFRLSKIYISHIENSPSETRDSLVWVFTERL